MASSFLPKPFTHHYEIDPQYAKSVVYFSCEFAIDQSFKIYSGGLGFLAGSHMRSAADLRQNLCGIGILWTYGYYNQARGEDRELAIQFRKKEYAFLQDTGIRFTVPVHGHPVWVKAMFLPGDVFGTVPMFFLSTDVEENDRCPAPSPTASTTRTTCAGSPNTSSSAPAAPGCSTNSVSIPKSGTSTRPTDFPPPSISTKNTTASMR
jgi:hypothetical protein